MPPFETADRRQKVVVWVKSGVDSYGQDTITAAVEKTVRLVKGFSDSFEQEGRTITVNAQLVTNEDLALGSQVWEGTLTDLPETPTDLWTIVRRSITPDLKARFTRYTFDLSRHSDSVLETT